MKDHNRSKKIRLQLDRISQQSAELQQQGRLEEAIAVATQALQLASRHFGEAHPDVAEHLANLASLYNALRDYASAEPLLRRALEIWRAAPEDHQSEIVAGLNIMAGVSRSRGDYDAAAELFRENISLLRALGVTDHPYFADRLTDLGLVYYCMDRVHAEQALPLFREALEIRRRILGNEDPKVVASLGNLASLYRSTARYVEAEPLFKEIVALEVQLNGKGSPEVASGLMELAELYQLMGQHGAAGPLVEEALEIYRTALGEDNPSVASALNNLGFLHYLTGNYDSAKQCYEEALKINRRLPEQRDSAVATCLNNLGELYKAIGDFARAESLLREGLEIRRRALGVTHPETVQSVNNLAALFRAIGDYAAAEPLYQEALEMRMAIFGEEHPDVADSLNNLGTLYSSMSNYASAEPLLQRGLELRRTVLGDDHPDVADSLNNVAWLWFALRKYALAEKLSRQSLEIRRKVLGEDHPSFAQGLSNLAAVLKARGNYAEAESLQRAALETVRKMFGENHPQVAHTLNNLAVLCAATDRESEAVSLMERAAAIEDQMIGQIFSFGSETQRMAHLKTLQTSLGAFLSLIVRHFAASPVAIPATLDFVLRRKAVGAEGLAIQRDAVLSGRYPELEPKLRALGQLRSLIAQKTLEGPAKQDLAVYRQLLVDWGVRRATLEAELVRQIPEMNLAQTLRSADRHAVAQNLPVGSALVEFIRFEAFDFKAVLGRGQSHWQPARYLAFVLRAGEPEDVRMVDLDDAERIDHLIAAFRTTVTAAQEGDGRHLVLAATTSGLGGPAENGSDLRAILFDPLLDALDGRRRLVLSPDGNLTRLPFEVLPTNDGRRLIDVYEISYVNVGRDVLRFGVGSTLPTSDPLVAADPDFDLAGEEAPLRTDGDLHWRRSRALDRSTVHFERLPGTSSEGERIAELLGVQPLLKESALEGLVKVRRSPRTLHLATHGFFLDDEREDLNGSFGFPLVGEMAAGRLVGQRLENPLLRSGLVLAGANTWLKGGVLPDEAEDGILTAEDVSGLDLLSTDLVVLSACETGLGEVRSGEGVFGLRRAFVLAGAKTLVMSLWKVDDDRTRELMEDFYGRLLQHEPRAEALRQAQLAMKAKHPEPYNWGAFICQGDPGPLPES